MLRLYNGIRMHNLGPSPRSAFRLDMNAMPFVQTCAGRGLQVDLSHFAKMEVDLSRDMERITEEVRESTGYYVNIDSGDQVADLLFKKLGLKQARIKLTSSGDRESVEDEVLKAIQHEHPVVGLVQDFKELSKLRGTYVVPMPKLATRTKFGVWRMFPNFKTTRVPSGRLSCSDPNLLAMPSRTDRGLEIRKGFITDPGWSYVSVDFSQIEVRMAAHSSGDRNLMSVYQNEEDIYSDFATSAFKLKDERYRDKSGEWKYPTVNKLEHRTPSKTCVLAALYDVTAVGLQEQMPVICANCGKKAMEHDCGKFEPRWTEDPCQNIINQFYIRYSGVMEDRKRAHRIARTRGYMYDMWGRVLHVAAVKSVHEWVQMAALREAANFVYQCVNGDSIVYQQGVGHRKIQDLAGEVTLWDGLRWSTGAVVKTGVKKQLRIELANGLYLKCSPDHRIYTTDTEGKRSWVEAGRLRASNKNTRVIVPHRVADTPDLPVRPVLLSNYRDRKALPDLSWAEHEPELFGEFLGRIASDGSVLFGRGNPKSVRLLVADHERSIGMKLLNICHKITDRVYMNTEVKQGYAPMRRLEIFSAQLADTLHSWGLKTRVPEIVMTNKALMRGYLRGVFDGDGGIISAKGGYGGTVQLTFGGNNDRDELAYGINMCLQSLGIRTRYRRRSHSIRIAVIQKDLWLFESLIGFMNPKKNKLLESIIPTRDEVEAAYGRAVSIKSIETLPDEEMWDFVNSSTGRFCANGIVVHNSGAQGIIKLAMAEVYDLWVEHLSEYCWPLLQIHDELLFECRTDMAKELGVLIKQVFENCVELRVPVKANWCTAPSWGLLPK